MPGSAFSRIVLTLLIAVPLAAQIESPAAGKAQPSAAPAPVQAATPIPLTPDQRGDIFMARKMYREAIEQYRQMPETATILNKLGIANHQLLDLGKAKRYYERAIRANPRYSEAANNLGTVFYALKSYRRAVNQYQKALKLSPDVASVYSNLGTAYFARKMYREGVEAYQQAIKLDPDVFEHRGSFGVLMQDSRVEERARVHYHVAKLYAQAGMKERALLYIRKSLEEGFKETKRFLEEPEFADVRAMPEFQLMMAQQPHAL
jgi:tetratricopeptide (TPR) repeat protein